MRKITQGLTGDERRELVCQLYTLFACLSPGEIKKFADGKPSWDIDNPEFVEKLLNVDLRGASLLGADLRDANWCGADFSNLKK